MRSGPSGRIPAAGTRVIASAAGTRTPGAVHSHALFCVWWQATMAWRLCGNEGGCRPSQRRPGVTISSGSPRLRLRSLTISQKPSKWVACLIVITLAVELVSLECVCSAWLVLPLPSFFHERGCPLRKTRARGLASMRRTHAHRHGETQNQCYTPKTLLMSKQSPSVEREQGSHSR